MVIRYGGSTTIQINNTSKTNKMKKFVSIIALLCASVAVTSAQSIKVINNSSCTIKSYVIAKNCSTCFCYGLKSNFFVVNPGTSVTIPSTVAVNTGIGWSSGGPATGSVGTAWTMCNVTNITNTPSAVVWGNICTTPRSGVTFGTCSSSVTWVSDAFGNVTVTVN